MTVVYQLFINGSELLNRKNFCTAIYGYVMMVLLECMHCCPTYKYVAQVRVRMRMRTRVRVRMRVCMRVG